MSEYFLPTMLGLAGASLLISSMANPSDGTRSMMTTTDNGIVVKEGICRTNKNGEESCKTFSESSQTQAAGLITNIRRKLSSFVKHLSSKYPNRRDVKLLVRRWNPNAVMEGSHNSGLTTYTLQKGKKIAFCLRDRDGTDRLHTDENTLIYVGLHELAHLMEKHHNPNHEGGFIDLWQFVLREAAELGIWQQHDYERNPVRYCGIYIDKNIL